MNPGRLGLETQPAAQLQRWAATSWRETNMDPNETLRMLRELSAASQDRELADAFDDLDRWLSNGGFPPEEWTGDVDPSHHQYTAEVASGRIREVYVV